MSKHDRDSRRRGLFEVSRDPILVHDVDDGRVVDANAAAERLLGYDADALAGLTLDSLDADDAEGGSALSSDDARDVLEDARETGETGFHVQFERADGEHRWVDATMRRARFRGRDRLLSFLRDVTERHELTDALHGSREALRDLHEKQMADGSPLEKVRAMLDTGRQFLDVEYAYLTRVVDGTQTVVDSVGGHDALAPGSDVPLAETYCQTTFDDDDSGSVCTVLDAGESMVDAPAYDRFGLGSYVGKQVTVDGDVYGTVCFAGDEPRNRPFSQAERMFVDVVAGWVGAELEREGRREELEERQRRVDALFNAPSSFIGVIDPDGTLIEANETALRIGGVEAEDVLGEPFWEGPWWSHDPGLEATVRDAIERARDGETVDFDAVHPAPDGGEVAVSVVIRPVVTDGEVETIVAHGVDVTEREEREQVLRRNQERLQTVLDNVPLVLFTVDEDGTFTLSKGNGLQDLGLEEDELVGENVFEVYDGYESTTAGIRRALDGERVAFEAEIESNFYRTWARPVREDGTVTGAIGVAVDVTERREQEERLETLSTANRRLMYPETPAGVANEAVEIVRDVLDEPMTAIWRYDEDEDALVPVAATDAARTTAGDGQLDGLETFESGTREYEAFQRDQIETIADYERVENGGSTVDGLRTVALIPLADHGLLAIGRLDVAAFTDVELNLLAVLGNNAIAALDRAEREQALERYRQELERSNESLQQFAYVASHDLQEPLRMVSSYVDLLAREYGDELDGDAAEYMEFAVDGADRMRSMIDALLTYSRVETNASEFEPVDVDSLLDDVLKNLELRIDETDATVTVGDLPTVSGDRDQLGQVFQNLVKNALEHAGDAPPEVVVDCEEREDAYAFSVADDGVGIPEDRTDAVFEIFRTEHASASGDGTGIGLAVVERIVHRHGGDVWVESPDGEGATFWFTMPKEADVLPGGNV